MGNYFWRNCLPSEKNSYKMKANNGFLAIGAKARLSQNPDVRDQMNDEIRFDPFRSDMGTRWSSQEK